MSHRGLRPTYQERLEAHRLICVAEDGFLKTDGQVRDWVKRLWWTHETLKTIVWIELSLRMDKSDFKRLNQVYHEYADEVSRGPIIDQLVMKGTKL